MPDLLPARSLDFALHTVNFCGLAAPAQSGLSLCWHFGISKAVEGNQYMKHRYSNVLVNSLPQSGMNRRHRSAFHRQNWVSSVIG
jgi:hypothetical protein